MAAPGAPVRRCAGALQDIAAPGTYVLKVRANGATGRGSKSALVKFWVLVARTKRG
jgi:hypothetical protein